jgi:hypothetical protein
MAKDRRPLLPFFIALTDRRAIDLKGGMELRPSRRSRMRSTFTSRASGTRTMTMMARLGRSSRLANCALIARKAAVRVKQQGPGSRTVVLTWAFGLERVTGIEPALSAWEAASILRLATPVGACDQEICHLGSAALPLWVEIWVENRCGREPVKADAAYCCSVIPDAEHPVARRGGVSPRCSDSQYGPQAK